MKQSKDIVAMVIDNGLFVELALTLSRTYKKVYYYCPWESGFPKMNDGMIGVGLGDIEVVDSPFKSFFDDIDLWVFPDVYFGELQCYLESLGKNVWGARMGEELELRRDDTKKLMKKLGIPVNKYEVAHGMDALRGKLKTAKDVWVKVNKWRGTFETFKVENYKLIEPKLDEVEANLGAFKHVMDFIIEDDLPDRIEIGNDFYTIDGEFPSQLLTGIEIKDKAYVGVFGQYGDLPASITSFDKAIAPTLKAYGYKGFASTELRIGKDKKPYMIDFCARAASPPNELYQEFYENIAEIIWKGAQGILIDPEPVDRYGAEILIHSSWADKNWQPIDFPAENRRYIKLRNATKINGKLYVVPQSVGLPEIGAVIGWGNTMKAAIEMVTEIAESVRGYYIDIPLSSFDEADEQIDLMAKFGLNIFDE